MASTMVSSSVKDNSFNQELLIQTEIQSLSKSAAQSFDNDDISQALRMFKTAFLLSCKLTEKQTQKACLFNLGAAYISAGKPQKGLKCLLKSKAEGSEATDASLYFNIAAAYDEMKEPTKAVKFYEKAIKSYGLSEINNIADALIKLSYCSVVTGNLPSAAHTFKLAGQAYQKLKKTDDAVMAMREAANYMIQSQKFSKLEVLSTLNICVQLCAGVTDKSLLGKLYNHIGLHYAEMKCFGQARQCFAESLDTCKGTSFSIRKKAVLLQNLGAIDNALGQYETSLRCHAEAADMYGTLGDRHAQGQCLCNLAFAYSQLKNYNMAEFYYQQALCAFSDVGEIHGQWQACEGLGATHFCLGNKDQAISYYKQALSLFGKSKETSDILRERILGKLVHVIEQKAMHQHPVSCGKSIPGIMLSSHKSFIGDLKSVISTEDHGMRSHNEPPPAESSNYKNRKRSAHRKMHSSELYRADLKSDWCSLRDNDDLDIDSGKHSTRCEEEFQKPDKPMGTTTSRICSLS